MNDPQNKSYPSEYYVVGIRTVKFTPLENGGTDIRKLDWETGQFIPGADYLYKILDGRDDVSEVSEEEFIQQTEQLRREHFKGDNTVFTLYNLLDSIEATAKAEGRELTKEEEAMIASTQRKTFDLFEKECRINQNYTKK